MKHKLLSILLCLAMALSLLPTAALAAEGTTEVKFTPKDGTEVTYKKAEDANGNITLYFDSEKDATNYATASYELNGKIVTFKGATLRSVNNLMRAYWEVCKKTTGCDYNPDMLPANESGTLTWAIYGKVEQGEYLNSGALILPALSGGYIYKNSGYQWKKIAVNAGTKNATIVSNDTFDVYHTYINTGTESTAFTGITFDGSFYVIPTGKVVFDNCEVKGLLRVSSGSGDVKVDNCRFTGDSDGNTTSKKNEYPFFYQAGGKLEFTNNTVSSDVYTRGLNVGGSTNLEAKINSNNIGAVSAGYSAIQLSGKVTSATISSNNIALDGTNAFTLHNSLSAMSTVSITDNTITGTGYLIYDDAAANNKSFTSDKLKLTYSSNTVPSTVDTTKGVKGSKTTALTGYVAAVTQGKDITGKVAQVGTEYYTTLTEAFAALDGTNHTLTLIDSSKWDAATPVYWKTNGGWTAVAKLTDALTAAYTANQGDITIVCCPGADVGTMTHGHVADNLTIYGNNAYLSGGECDLEVDTYKFSRATGAQANDGAYLNKNITITAYELDNLGVWGQRHTDYTVNINLTDCDGKAIEGKDNLQRVYISNPVGENNITLINCDFLTKATAVYSNADGSIMINNCSFTGGQVPVNFNHKANGTQTVTVKNSKFTNCGDEGDWKKFAAPVRFVNSGNGTMSANVDACTITGTVGNNGDILIGDGRTNETSNDVSLTVKNTAADVQAQKPGYYAADGTVAEAGNVSKTTIPASETPTTINLESNKDFKLAEVNGVQMSSLTDALDNARSSNKPIKLLSADTALVQAILDGQYGSIDGLTIELPTGNYGQLELGRATKYEGSNTEYYVGGFDESAANYQEFNSAEALKTYKNGGGWTPLCYYVRNMSDVTLKAADGATVNVAGVKMTSGHMYGSSGAPNYDYVLDREVPSTNESYYLAQTVSNITFVGLNFTAKSDINTSNEETVINGFTFKNCTFNINNTASGNQAIRYYNENNNGKVSNLVVDNCKFNNCFQGVYTSHIKNVFVTNSEFDTTRHNAIAIQDFNGACDHGKVIITGNTFKNIGDRIIRFGNVGADTQITITHNTVIGELIKKEVIKAESLADGVTCNIHSNSWGDGATVANDQFKDTAAPSYSGSSSSYDPTYSVSTPSKTENGSVTVSPKSASKGDTVTVTVKPDSGYVLETLTVTDKNGNELTLKDKGNGKYTFTMPAGKVEVKATFMEDNSMLNFFYDVPNNAYFYEAVKWAVENGITTGVGNDLFAPEQPCTRAQIVTFLWRAAGSPEPKDAASGMTDVVSGSYYEKAVAWAIENGITTGTTTSTFSPDVTCTRAQAVTFLARALSAKAASAAEFSDVPNDSYFADAVAWAAANGVTEGIGGGLFGSDNDCTRGQIVTFLYRAYNK